MEQTGRRTKAFRSFARSIDRAYALVDIIQRGGLQAIAEQNMAADHLSQQVAGIDMATLAALNGEAREAANAAAPQTTVAEMNQVAERAQTIADVAIETTPQVLLIYAVTLFENYLEQVTLAVVGSRPHLLSGPEQAKYAAGRGANPAKLAGQDVAARLHALLFNARWDWIGEELFDRGLGIPFAQICQHAQTSPAELDRVKAVRNIHLHNQGKVDRQFRERVGDPTLRLGDDYPLTAAYLVDVNPKMYLTALGIDMVVAAKYPTALTA
jgi:hypothetical protein